MSTSGKDWLDPRTSKALVDVMGGQEFKSADVIGREMGKTAAAADQMVRRLYKKGLTERVEEPKSNGGFRYLWRAVPAGYQAPLYNAQQGIDGRALDECLGGYTYLKTAAPNVESHK